jgi:surface antigen
MFPRILTVTIVIFELAACSSLAPGDPALYQGLADSDVKLASRLVQTTLESTPDGTTQSWTNKQTGHSGEITPLRTYLTEDGAFCRDYREELAIAGETGRFYHTACRDGPARWVWLQESSPAT